MTRHIWMPDAEQVAEIHRELTAVFADEADPISPSGIKNEAMLESACQRPFTGIGETEKYPTVWLKIAALFHSLVKNHPFHNGNKRAAIVALLTTLYRNDYRFTNSVGDDEIYDFAIRVTGDRFPDDSAPAIGDDLIEKIAAWLSHNSESLSTSVQGMRMTEFLKRCRQAGCAVKKGKRGWVVQNHGKGSVTISQSTPQIAGNVVKRWLQRLALTASASGILGEEFHEGVTGERDEMHRFMSALRRLAKT